MMYSRPVLIAAKAVEQEPAKGSKTTPPFGGRVKVHKYSSILTGFTVSHYPQTFIVCCILNHF
jgi:hypothetical protein